MTGSTQEREEKTGSEPSVGVSQTNRAADTTMWGGFSKHGLQQFRRCTERGQSGAED